MQPSPPSSGNGGKGANGPSLGPQGCQQNRGTFTGHIWVVTRGKAKKEADFPLEPPATDEHAPAAGPLPACDPPAMLEGLGEPIPPPPIVSNAGWGEEIPLPAEVSDAGLGGDIPPPPAVTAKGMGEEIHPPVATSVNMATYVDSGDSDSDIILQEIIEIAKIESLAPPLPSDPSHSPSSSLLIGQPPATTMTAGAANDGADDQPMEAQRSARAKGKERARGRPSKMCIPRKKSRAEKNVRAPSPTHSHCSDDFPVELMSENSREGVQTAVQPGVSALSQSSESSIIFFLLRQGVLQVLPPPLAWARHRKHQVRL